MSHTTRMLIATLIPSALLFLLPAIGVDGGGTLAGFVIVLFVLHLILLPGDPGNSKSNRENH